MKRDKSLTLRMKFSEAQAEMQVREVVSKGMPSTFRLELHESDDDCELTDAARPQRETRTRINDEDAFISPSLCFTLFSLSGGRKLMEEV